MILEDHGGTIDYFSKEGDGTTFVIELDLHAEFVEVCFEQETHDERTTFTYVAE